MFQKIVEFFIPVQQDKGTEYKRRIRLITYAIVVTMVFALFYVLVSWIAGYFIGLLIMLGSWIGYLVLLFLIKKGVNIFKIANFFGLIGALSIYGSIYFSGGFDSPVLPWLASTPIVLLLIAGEKSGYAWAFVSVVMVSVFGLMKYFGFEFPTEYHASKETYFALSSQSGLVLIIFFISIVFENLRKNAFNQISEQKNTLEKTLNELKSTQSQLIQSEKMASLGELTAGIAHEIQNPLNFVNNFSELSNELIEELKDERLKVKGERLKDKSNQPARQSCSGGNEDVRQGEEDEEVEEEILNNIANNLKKILHHGKRADAIVKGMLQHSQTSSGQKESIDINALADEYLRLAFHGLRAKDNAFNATMKTEFDESLPEINVIPQEIGRVLVNLISNAFYAVNERSKNGEPGYEPTVNVSTFKVGDKFEIKVSDNGPGIPAQIIDKIFQPFFTTKPTGQGTGLGLSLSYDIVKAHGGELKVVTKEGIGSEFILQLPNS